MRTYTASAPDAPTMTGLTRDQIVTAMQRTHDDSVVFRALGVLDCDGSVTYSLFYGGKCRTLTITEERVVNRYTKAYDTVSKMK